MDIKNQVYLQKTIAERTIYSRRKAEILIKKNLVKVNGFDSKVGDKIDQLKDTITIEGKAIPNKSFDTAQVFMLFKPKGYICSHKDPYNKNTIYNLLPKEIINKKIICAGRLDKESEGMLILTNNGFIANKIMHPSNKIIKRYHIEINKQLDEEIIPKLLQGIYDNGEHLYAKNIIFKKNIFKLNNKFDIYLDQGHKREIRRLLNHFGYKVIELHRFQIGSLKLEGLSKGSFKKIKNSEINLLFKN